MRRLTTIAALYAIHGVAWCAIKVLDGCHLAASSLIPDRQWIPCPGGQTQAETDCRDCQGSGVDQRVGDDYCGSCGGPGIDWLTPAELAREMSHE